MTSFPRSRSTAALAALLAVVTSSAGLAAPAAGDTHQRARHRFDEGLALVDAGNVAAALLAFKDAYALEPNPAVLYNIGQALRALDRPEEALEALERYRAEAAGSLDAARRAAVERQVSELRARLSRPLPAPASAAAQPATGELELRCLAAGTRVFADGRWLGEGPFEGRLTVAEGLHEVRFERPDRSVEVRSTRIEPGGRAAQTCTLPIAVPPAPALVTAPAPPRPARATGPLVVAGSGGALLAGALAVYLWNDQRYRTWQGDRDATALLDDAEPTTADRKRAINERLTGIDRADQVALGLAAAGGLLVSIGATWWWARH